MDTTWIDTFLPVFRCPDTQHPLRWATAADLQRHARAADEKALVTEDGSRLFEIDHGIPVLLPQESKG